MGPVTRHLSFACPVQNNDLGIKNYQSPISGFSRRNNYMQIQSFP